MTRLATMVALALTVAAACGGNNTATAPAQGGGGTVTVRQAGDWQTFDPYSLQIGRTNTLTEEAVYDRLLYYTGGKVYPYLAKSYKQTATAFTFTLRNDVTCSDGTRLTPQLVLTAFQHVVKGPYASQMFGAGPYNLSADDAAGTFTFSSVTPFSDMLYGFTDYRASILCPAAFSGNQATTPAGTGAFTIAEAVHGDHIALKGRQDWAWGPNGLTARTPGFPQSLVIKIIANDTTAANLLTTGGLDVTPLNGPDVQRLSGDRSVRHIQGRGDAISVLLFNELPGQVLADEQVRFAREPEAELKESGALRCALVREIRRWRPDVVIGFDPTPALHQHPDHRVTGRLTLDAAWPCAGSAAVYPEAGSARQPAEAWLFETATPDLFVRSPGKEERFAQVDLRPR